MTKSLKGLPNKVFRFIQQTLFRVCGKKFFLGKWGSGEVGKWGSCLITLSPQNPITLFIS
ncbi:hypothetical protein B1L04_09940 [Microcystis aeruginosa KW]|uniref:Uncharacterized protein n=1 Tax=Microcystis aeruginosa KW TaxID=1960155 RepID=A0A1V4BY33_MICAE|nr:hypothetical protein [Microcystis aeruginosa]OPF19583.1 hypothetical protein B1L04_09940 [Microcystis aeruginosa KW]